MVEDDLIFAGFSDLERIQIINHHLSSLQTHSKQWSMVKIKDSFPPQTNKINDFDFSVFPPTNHENLHISSLQHQENQEKQPKDASSKQPSPSPLAPPDFDMQRLSSSSKLWIIGWFDFGLEFLRAKICSVVSLFCNSWATKGALWSAAGMAIFCMWWWLCRRLRRRSGKESVEHLKLMIEEKDEKIMKLLHQIAQMNEILVARHKVLASKLNN